MRNSAIWPLGQRRRRIELETEVSECGTFQMISVIGRLTIDTTPELLTELRRVVREAHLLLDGHRLTLGRGPGAAAGPT